MSDQGFSEEEVAAYWNVNAGPWAQEVREGRDVARECLNNPAFLRLLGDLRDRDVLDAGCGEGHNTRLLARAGARMTGVDISERMIALAVDEERRAPLGIRYVCTAYTRLEMFPSASFDALVSFKAVGLLADRDAFYVEHRGRGELEGAAAGTTVCLRCSYGARLSRGVPPDPHCDSPNGSAPP